MKTQKLKTAILFVVMTVIFGFSSYADNAPTEKIRNSISNQVIYPASAKDLLIEGDVVVTFGVNENGKVEVYSAISDKEELAKYIKENFADFDFSSVNMVKGQKYRITITFDLL